MRTHPVLKKETNLWNCYSSFTVFILLSHSPSSSPSAVPHVFVYVTVPLSSSLCLLCFILYLSTILLQSYYNDPAGSLTLPVDPVYACQVETEVKNTSRKEDAGAQGRPSVRSALQPAQTSMKGHSLFLFPLPSVQERPLGQFPSIIAISDALLPSLTLKLCYLKTASCVLSDRLT